MQPGYTHASENNGVPDTPLEMDMLHKQQDGITE